MPATPKCLAMQADMYKMPYNSTPSPLLANWRVSFSTPCFNQGLTDCCIVNKITFIKDPSLVTRVHFLDIFRNEEEEPHSPAGRKAAHSICLRFPLRYYSAAIFIVKLLIAFASNSH